MTKIDDFVKHYEKRSQYTVNNYRSALKQYFRVIEKDPDTYFDAPNEDEYKKDIEKFWDTIIDAPPKTRDNRLFCIKSFMVRNGVELKTMFYKELREEAKEKGSLSEDHIPSIDDMKKILAHAGVRDRAWILLACTSGMRIGEITKLRKDNLKLDQDPPYIFLPASITKNGHKRFTFCTTETAESLKEWLRVRDDYLGKLSGKNNLPNNGTKYHDIKDPKIFPFHYSVFLRKWWEIIDTLDMGDVDDRTKRRKLHIHCLRKFANTRMLLTMPEAKVNFIIGHSTYLSEEYNRFEPSQIAPDYRRAMNDLLIFVSSEISGINESLKEKDEEIKTIKAQLMDKRLETVEMKQRIEALEKALKERKN